MKRILLSVLLIACTTLAFAQEISVTDSGMNTKIAWTTLSAPFDIVGPKDGDVYLWTLPAGVVAKEEKHTLKVQKAPKGTLTFGVRTLKIDWTNKTVENKPSLITVTVLNGPKATADSPPSPPEPRTGGMPSVAVEPSSVVLGKDVTVSYSNTVPGDWVGLYEGSNLVDWRLCTGKKSSLIFSPTATGQYKIKIMAMEEDGHRELSVTALAVSEASAK